MIDGSRAILPIELRKADSKIVLNSNGTFSAYEMPALFAFPDFRAARLESGSGVWRLESSEGEQQIQLDFNAIVSWEKNSLPYGTQLYVSKGRSAVTLYYFLGDADEGERLEFEKR